MKQWKFIAYGAIVATALMVVMSTYSDILRLLVMLGLFALALFIEKRL